MAAKLNIVRAPDDDAYIRAAKDRRKRLAKKIGDGALIVKAAPGANKSRDVFHPYRFDSYLYYLTAFAEPECALIITAKKGKLQSETLFCRARDAKKEQWDGEITGPARARRWFAIKDAADIGEFAAAVAKTAREHCEVFFLPNTNAALDRQLTNLMSQRRTRGGGLALSCLRDASALLDEMRMVKDASEITRMREAARLTCAGHLAAMRAKPMTREYHIEAAITSQFKMGGGDHAFPPIVASGGNACTLHHTKNNSPVRRGQLVLVDAGCEWRGYAGDVTRVFPANGKFSEPQRAVYDVVLQAQRRAIAAVKPGANIDAPEKAALRALCAGLKKLGLCKGSVADIMRKKTCRRFYPHRVGHFLGLDVHDVGVAQKFRAGMVVTIEPGLYVPADSDIPAPLRNIGVRIEDDILVTSRGNEVLTDAAPKTPSAIERWLRA